MAEDFTSATDGMLVEAARWGLPGAMAEIVRRYQRPLLAAARNRLGDHQAAEDAVQEAFFNTHRWIHTYDSRYSFRTWLWTILLRACSRIAENRSARKWCSQPLDSSTGETGPTASAAAVNPLDQLLASENSALLQRLLARLPENQADALRLRFFGELKFDEIAAALECSVSTAKNRVKLGLIQLAAWLNALPRDA